ncbi:MAG: glutamate-5-semialdehyde dehydrogenase [Verrucomicrobiae bacterium]|nr:glutamate-5-semialdehyde dehydrogenase [Verrucomicrobiae bacterium]
MNRTAAMIEGMGRKARAAALKLASTPTETKRAALRAMADAFEKARARLVAENAKDVARAKKEGLAPAMVERLTLDAKRVAAMAQGVRAVAALPDPVGEILREWTRPNGLRIRKVRVPLGVIGIIYESRPNVTADSGALCLMAGNACILRGGREAIRSNAAIAGLMREAGDKAGLPPDSLQLVRTTDREAVRALARLDQYLACIVPRGGEGLIRAVVEHATVPVVKHYKGVCHVFVDRAADLAMAREIALNAKCQRPSVCNAMETLLVHCGAAERFLPGFAKELFARGVELRADPKARAFLGKGGKVRAARPADWGTEYNALVLNVRVVDSLDEAIAHINRHGSAHSDSIVTSDTGAAERFLAEVDSATVYHNASTRFTDGGEFGMGAEIGISTDRLHARGPMALEELTTYKYLIHGSGQIRA